MAGLPSAAALTGYGLAATAVIDPGAASTESWVMFIAAGLAPLLAALVLARAEPRFDVVLLAGVGMLTAVGVTTLLLLSARPGPDQPFFASIAVRHAVFVVAGFAMLVVGALASRGAVMMRRYPLTLLTMALASIAVTAVFGETINGARLWLDVGAVRFQPAEAARLLLAAFMAVYLYDRRHLIASSWRVGTIDLPPAPFLFPFAAAVLGAVAVLVFQSDLGMAALVALGAVCALAVVLASTSSLVIALLLVAGTAAGSYLSIPRVRDRVAGWLDPWADPVARGFQFVQAEYAVAGGGVVGSGFADGSTHIPEVHTDLILAAVASQFGWVGAAGVLVITGVVVCRCAQAALRSTDGFVSLLIVSFTALIGIQIILIAGGTLRVLPLTGLTYPLLSYGGTSMLVTMFAVGVILGLDAQTQRSRDQAPPV